MWHCWLIRKNMRWLEKKAVILLSINPLLLGPISFLKTPSGVLTVRLLQLLCVLCGTKKKKLKIQSLGSSFRQDIIMRTANGLKSNMIQYDRTWLQSYKYVSAIINLSSCYLPLTLLHFVRQFKSFFSYNKSDTVYRLPSVLYRNRERGPTSLTSKQWMNSWHTSLKKHAYGSGE